MLRRKRATADAGSNGDATTEQDLDEAEYDDEYDEDGEYADDAEYEDDEAEDDSVDEYDDEYDEDAEDDEAEDDSVDEYDEDGEYDGDGEYDDGEYDEDQAPAEDFKPPGFTDALRQVFNPSGRGRTAGAGTTSRPARPRAQPASGTEEDRKRVIFIDKRERIIGFTFAAIQLGLAILNYVAYRSYVDKKDPSKALSVHHAAPWVLGLGVLFTVFILAATISKRRAALGFVVLLSGLELLQTGGGLFGIVFFGFGIWLVFKALRNNPRNQAMREQREQARAERAGARGGTRDASRAARPRTSTTSSSSRPASVGRTTGGPTRQGSSSKRYTPPKQHRPVPQKEQPEPEPTNRVMSWLKR